MTKQERLGIRARCEAATPEPWTYDERVGCVAVYQGEIVNCVYDADDRFLYYADGFKVNGKWHVAKPDCANAKFIASARQDIPDLLDALEAAYKEIERLKIKCAETFMPEEDYLG